MEAGWAEQDDENVEQQKQGDVPLHLQIFYSGQQDEEPDDLAAAHDTATMTGQ